MQQYMKPPSRKDTKPQAPDPGFFVRDAPWNKAPDTTNTTDFPSISASNSAPTKTPSWGPKR
ncbi:Vigilin [Holothuria leucospilota]|nr:Vigilin [Holothuria leucospilota]